MGGGALIDLGVHVLDHALWLMGYPTPVSMSGAMFAEFGMRGQKARPRDIKPSAFDVEESGMGFVRFADRSVLQFESAWASRREHNTEAYFVRLFRSEAGANFYMAGANRETVALYQYVADQSSAIIPKLQRGISGHHRAVHHFVDCLLHINTPKSPADHGVTGSKIIDGIYKSAQIGCEVML